MCPIRGRGEHPYGQRRLEQRAYRDALDHTPDECLRKIKRYAEAGCDRVICYKQFGYIDNEDVKRSMQLLGEHVIPKLKDIQPPR